MAEIPTFRDLARASRPGPRVNTKWSKARVDTRQYSPTPTPSVTPTTTPTPTPTSTS